MRFPREKLFLRLKIFFVISAMLIMAALAPQAEAAGKTVTAPLTGIVGVQMEEFVGKVIRQAEDDRAGLIIFKLETPGGLVEATRGITQAILASKVPVAMWVPPGGRAASAGVFMMQAAHVSAMSSGSNIGAAHPVEVGGGDVPGDMKQKVVNDLMAQMRSLTQLRGRNEEMGQRMVEESVSLTAREALEQNVIDIIADDMESLLSAVRGRHVQVDGKQAVIEISGIAENVEMSFQEQIIQFLSDPNIAYMLLVGGMLALFYEIITPGGFALGTTGAVMLLLGGIGLKMLPFNWAGVALVAAGVIVMGIDLMLGGTGLLTLLGIGVVVAGGVFLFRAPGGELLNVSLSMMAGMAVTLGLCCALFGFMITKTLRSKVVTGRQGLVGLDAEITRDLAPEGTVKCHGEIWKARAEGEPLRKGDPAQVAAVDGITLIVKAK